jgi:hypothetical protein
MPGERACQSGNNGLEDRMYKMAVPPRFSLTAYPQNQKLTQEMLLWATDQKIF